MYKIQVPNAVFPTDNDQDIPLLDISMQADFLDAPFRAWGSVARKSRMSGTWHFYVADYKFEALWKNPDQLVKTACRTTVEVNFSSDEQQPYPVALWNIYRKRWMARYWQTKGIRLFVDLNVDSRFREINLLGVPRGWNAFATRWNNSVETLAADLQMARDLSGKTTPNMVVYSGSPAAREFCQENGLLWVQNKIEIESQAKHEMPVFAFAEATTARNGVLF